jgi:dienelactone hydrolase
MQRGFENAREVIVAVEKILYQAGNVTGHGVLVWNEKISGNRPLMLVMTNWLGVTDIAINRAAKMAGDKYVAFVADIRRNRRI